MSNELGFHTGFGLIKLRHSHPDNYNPATRRTSSRVYDSASGIEAYIRPAGSETQYPEYDAPRGSPLHTGKPREKYIEAVTDERFELVTILHPEFTFHGKSHVETEKSIDGGTTRCAKWLSRAEREPGKPLIEECNGLKAYVNGVWRNVHFSFGQLSSIEDADLSKEEEVNEISKRGKLVVTVQRGTATRHAVRSGDLKSKGVAALPVVTSKRVAVEHGKSHSMKAVVGDAIDAPRRKTLFSPAMGKIGQPIAFTFFYTSRMILEMKKILPDIPMPSPITPAPSAISTMSIPQPTAKRARVSDKYVICIDDDDDEESLPRKKVKIEPSDSANANAQSADNHASPSVKIKTEDEPSQHGSNSNITHANQSEAITPTPNGTAEDEKARKKAKLLLELREIRFEKRLMELEENGGG